ncbi:MAG: molybdenum cofactor biosynthesis protein MoaE [Actinomycetota bacterium]
MADPVSIVLTSDPLDPARALELVSDAAAGGTCVFVGTVREHSDAGDVTGLRYESYEELAETRLREIAEELFQRWPVCRAALHHRTGDLDVGEISVIVACSTPHRADAFEACRHGIERIKSDVPIWKQERLTTGDAHWVRGS